MTTTITTWSTLGAAKLNLTLEVIGKRADGFHDLASVAVSLDLADEVRLSVGAAGGGERSISYRDDGGRPVSIETSDDIIARVWAALASRCELPSGAAVEVVKRIPITSGLGGGSTDAAAFLRLARRAWDLPLSDADLCEVGSEVGSDVPVCVIGGAALMQGRGERVSPLSIPPASLPDRSVLLYRPEIPAPAAKTATMYRSLRSSDYRDGAATAALVEAWSSGTQPTQADCVNSFDAPAREVMQGLSAARRRMGSAIAQASMAVGVEPAIPLLAGAGPTLFAMLRPDLAADAAERLREPSGFTRVARLLDREDATAIRTR